MTEKKEKHAHAWIVCHSNLGYATLQKYQIREDNGNNLCNLRYQCQYIRLFQASAEDVSVSMSGRLVAADSTSEEVLEGDYSK